MGEMYGTVTAMTMAHAPLQSAHRRGHCAKCLKHTHSACLQDSPRQRGPSLPHRPDEKREVQGVK